MERIIYGEKNTFEIMRLAAAIRGYGL